VSGTSSTAVEKPAPEGLTSLVAGHNDIDADRINLIFTGWGWDGGSAELAPIVDMFLGWDGTAQVYTTSGRPAAADDGAAAELGLFGWEPFRSNRDRFNVWLSDLSPEGPVDWLNGNKPDPLDIPNAVYVVMALDVDRVLENPNSLAGQLTEITQPDPVRLSDDPFDNVMISVVSQYPALTLLDLPHELGHALFNLPDEYVGRSFGYTGDRNSFYPSCPADLETAQAWWGDRLGETDPSVDTWAAELTAAGYPPDPERVDAVRAATTLALVEGGCFDVPGSYRMAEDTLMGYATPGFGVANVEAGHAVLDLFAGSAG
jgi:hypothetical protein